MKLNKRQISTLNRMAIVNFESAWDALKLLNEVMGTKYGWLGGRVVFFDDPDAPDHIRYAHAHDAYAYAEE